MTLSQADGGTLYLRNDDQRLEFAIMRTLSTGAAFGGTTGRATGVTPSLTASDRTTASPPCWRPYKRVLTYV